MINDILKKHKKIYVLNINLTGAGFGAVLLTTLSQLRYCERQNYYPIINYDSTSLNAFFDSTKGNDLWNQYFQPILPFTYQNLKNALQSSQVTEQDLITLPSDEMIKICEEHPDSIYSYTFGKWRFNKPEQLDEWYALQRKKGQETIQKYVKLKNDIKNKVDQFYNDHLAGSFVLGIHIRGTDLHYAPPVSPPEYFPHIDELIKQHPVLKIFLATDQRQYIDAFKEKYGDKVFYSDCFRSDNEIAPFNRKEISPHKKGEDVLLDILLLSKSDFLLKGTSNVSEFALYFNPLLKCKDLSISKIKAFGQDYGDGWDNMANKPAWEIIGAKNIREKSQNISSQNLIQLIKFNIRKKYLNTRNNVSQSTIYRICKKRFKSLIE